MTKHAIEIPKRALCQATCAATPGLKPSTSTRSRSSALSSPRSWAHTHLVLTSTSLMAHPALRVTPPSLPFIWGSLTPLHKITLQLCPLICSFPTLVFRLCLLLAASAHYLPHLHSSPLFWVTGLLKLHCENKETYSITCSQHAWYYILPNSTFPLPCPLDSSSHSKTYNMKYHRLRPTNRIH